MYALAAVAIVHCLMARSVLLLTPTGEAASRIATERTADIIARMQAAYAQIESYETKTEVTVYREGRVDETQRFFYSFEKPNRIRVEFETPHSGMVLTYPDKNGKVDVKPGGWTGFLRFHFSPDSSVFKSAAGQRIDQTDLGLLVQNIVHSLTDRKRGEIGITARDGLVVLEVLADDHFLPGVRTLYRFTIDENRWLPVSVRELSPEGIPRRDVTFHDLKTSSGIHDGTPIVGGSPDHGRPSP